MRSLQARLLARPFAFRRHSLRKGAVENRDFAASIIRIVLTRSRFEFVLVFHRVGGARLDATKIKDTR